MMDLSKIISVEKLKNVHRNQPNNKDSIQYIILRY
jgi:hypothetical protein